MKKGEEIEIVSGTSDFDKQTLKDIKRILARNSYELDENEIREKNESFILTRLKKTSCNHKKGDSSCQQSN
jgi:TusA-related sulfurtransferase